MENNSKKINQIKQDYQIDFDFIDGRSSVNRNSNLAKNKVEVPRFTPPVQKPKETFTVQTPKQNVSWENYERPKPIPNKTTSQAKRSSTVIRIVCLILTLGILGLLLFDLINTYY